MTMTIYATEGEPLEYAPPRHTLWCVRCAPAREFTGPKCLAQLAAHYAAWHDPYTPRQMKITLMKKGEA